MRLAISSICFLLSTLCSAQTFYNNSAYPIYDTTVSYIPVTVSGLTTAINSSFGLFSACFNIMHSNDSHLVLQIQSPDGSVITLASGIGGSGQNFINTCTQMNGSSGYIVNSSAPFSGNYFPQQSLNLLNNGQNPNGLWKLIVNDTYFGDSGSAQGFSITFASFPPPDPPPPPLSCSYCTCENHLDTCFLLPDLTASSLSIQNNHTEMPGYLFLANATPNIGRGPIEVHPVDDCFCDTIPVPCTSFCPPLKMFKRKVIQRIYRKHGNDTLSHIDKFAGYMTYHPEHHHLHVDDWSDFSVRIKTSQADPVKWPIVSSSVKQSFCLVNLSNCSGSPGYCRDSVGNILLDMNIPNAGFGLYSGCGQDQGIYPGFYDEYNQQQNQPINLGRLCNGDYQIVSVTDPKNYFLESNERNNSVTVPITFTEQKPALGAASFNYSVNGFQANFTNSSPQGQYLWDYGDGIWDTIYNASHTYSTPGIYSVTLVSFNQCYTAITRTVETTTFSAVISSDLNFQVYDNPLTDNSFVTFYLDAKTGYELLMTDVSGRIIQRFHDNEQQGLQSIALSPPQSLLSAGVYFLTLKVDTRKSETRKILKK